MLQMNHSDWSALTVKKKDRKIRVWSDFSIGLNDCVMDNGYLLPEDFFQN